jgi:hypothetical protein
MELIVIRKFFYDTYTIGRMLVDGVKLCETLEDKIRDLKDLNHDGDFDDEGEGKIYGETAIPCGRYQVIVSYSPKFAKRLPELLKVPGFQNIRIHAGANAKQTEGCILVGDNKVKGSLVNGGYYQTLLVQMIDEAVENNEHCYITIKE